MAIDQNLAYRQFVWKIIVLLDAHPLRPDLGFRPVHKVIATAQGDATSKVRMACTILFKQHKATRATHVGIAKVDVVIVGAGTAGMTAAIVSQSEGLEPEGDYESDELPFLKGTKLIDYFPKVDNRTFIGYA